MQERRKSDSDRRTAERRVSEKDPRPDSEKGIVGERRSGSDRRGSKDRRQVGENQPAWF